MSIRPFSVIDLLRTPDRFGFRSALPGFLRYAGLLTLLQGLMSPVFSDTPAGWKTTQDMSKACQVAFPPNWTVTPDGQATTADNGQADVVVGSSKPLEPMDASMQKMMQVDRMIENSSKRVFYLMKPQGERLEYIVDQQFKTSRCVFQLFVPKGYSDAEVLKIVATLQSTH